MSGVPPADGDGQEAVIDALTVLLLGTELLHGQWAGMPDDERTAMLRVIGEQAHRIERVLFPSFGSP